MTTESGADSEAKQPQENKETEKGKAKAAEPTSPQNQPEQLPAAAGHSTPARKEQVSLYITTVRIEPTKGGFSQLSVQLEFSENHSPLNVLFFLKVFLLLKNKKLKL